MTPLRFLYALTLLLLPLVVAWFGLSVFSAIVLVLLLLLWRQGLVLSALMNPPAGPEIELETIINSHFAEKARWCLDRLGVEYTEKPWAGIVGVFFRGRTVPMLNVRTGRTRASVCESSEILRYLYGRYVAERGEAAAFLEPTPERLAWEERLDRYGAQLQVWIYFHLLDDPVQCKEAWGANSERIPTWQRWTLLVCFPVFVGFIRRAFQPDRDHNRKAVERIEALLADTEKLLADGRSTLLGGASPDFVDFTLAGLSSLWAWPEQFAAGRYDEDRPAFQSLPERMRADVERWRAAYPATAAHIDRLYADERR